MNHADIVVEVLEIQMPDQRLQKAELPVFEGIELPP